MAGIFCENFNSLPDGFDYGRADEDHLDRFLAQLGFAHVNVAGKLAAVAVAQDADVEQAERGLRWAVHLAREQDRAGASAEKRAAARGEPLQRVEEAVLGHYS